MPDRSTYPRTSGEAARFTPPATGSAAKRRLLVVHLEDNPTDRQSVKGISSTIKSAIRSFLEKNFGRTAGEMEVVLKTVPDIRRLLSLLDVVDGRPTTGDAVILFILDYFVPLGAADDSVWTRTPLLRGGVSALSDVMIRNSPFAEWLAACFPTTPTLLLTSAGRKVTESMPRDFIRIPKDSLQNPNELGRNIRQVLGDRFAPVFWHELQSYADDDAADSWHTPGHNRGNAFRTSPLQRGFHTAFGERAFTTDISVSVDRLGDLSEPDLDLPLSAAQTRSARIFGARETFFVTNGSSTSNKALLMTLLRPGEVVAVDRNCHKSVHQSIIMAGAVPLYLPTGYNERLGVWAPVSVSAISGCLDQAFVAGVTPRVLILTSCTYEGIHYPVHQIAAMCERYGMLLIADEAWGAHARFHSSFVGWTGVDDGDRVFRYSALDGGAHLVVHSSHKTLAAFSQASMVHVSERLEELLEGDGEAFVWLRRRFGHGANGSYRRFRHELIEVLRYWHSTSPHYPMLATLELAGIQMGIEGGALLSERLQWVRDELMQNARIGPALADLPHIVGPTIGDYAGYYKDPLKVLVRLRNEGEGAFRRGRSREVLGRALESAHIQWEKSSVGSMEFLVTIGTSRRNVEGLATVLIEHSDLLDPADVPDAPRYDPGWTQLGLTPRDAMFHSDAELVELDLDADSDDTLGRIAAQLLVPYPPGIPLVVPGLIMTPALRDWVRHSARDGGRHQVHGLLEESGRCYVRMLSESASRAALDGDGPARRLNRITEVAT